MKKSSLTILLLIMTLALAACSTSEQEPAAEAPVAASADDSAESAAMDDTMADSDMAEEAAHDDAMDDAMMEDEAADDESAMMDDDQAHSDAAMADDEAMMDDEMASSDELADDDAMAEAPAEEAATAVDPATLPAWQTVALTNARTGEQFTLADFSGQTVFVEPMATWCTNCRRQLENVRDARAAVGDDAVFVALSLETNLEDAQLAAYADQQGFDWLFAVMTPDLLGQLADEFGRTITSAPSTPHFLIRPDGSFTDLTTGIESPEQIAEQIKAAMEG